MAMGRVRTRTGHSFSMAKVILASSFVWHLRWQLVPAWMFRVGSAIEPTDEMTMRQPRVTCLPVVSAASNVCSC